MVKAFTTSSKIKHTVLNYVQPYKFYFRHHRVYVLGQATATHKYTGMARYLGLAIKLRLRTLQDLLFWGVRFVILHMGIVVLVPRSQDNANYE